ncbi:hypothetical protein MtrunA17_Chr0c31g0494151 [Medicago truncatula]|uniref:Uncharacterized protein n=1 Tax=Medicago truncatula TaxID=3880 RepID=A0A396GCJ1_MEDTR|nr:hypothetical protein MtrunA17_Chr0c31g0494151 [Medicago truncatula]
MGTKAKKAMHKSLKRINAKPSHSQPAADFLPLDCGPGRKLPELKPWKILPCFIHWSHSTRVL